MGFVLKGTELPVYVTNETADGKIGSFTLNAYVAFAIYMIAIFNAFGWGVYGLYVLGGKIL
jgi:hypothetical protein